MYPNINLTIVSFSVAVEKISTMEVSESTGMYGVCVSVIPSVMCFTHVLLLLASLSTCTDRPSLMDGKPIVTLTSGFTVSQIQKFSYSESSNPLSFFFLTVF